MRLWGEVWAAHRPGTLAGRGASFPHHPASPVREEGIKEKWWPLQGLYFVVPISVARLPGERSKSGGVRPEDRRRGRVLQGPSCVVSRGSRQLGGSGSKSNKTSCCALVLPRRPGGENT